MRKVIDKKTGRELHTGDTLIRKDYKGFKHRYELIDLHVGAHMIRVKKLLHDDRWVFLCVPLSSLQLEVYLI
jgi:hypothetical protein